MKKLRDLSIILAVYLLAFAAGYFACKWIDSVVGCLSVILLFNAVSIPMMEKRQLERRPDYGDYQESTSRVFLLPHKAH